ncbi:MAG: hypothetical protein WAX69_18615 [Victivallales bacterium]
MKFWNKKSTAFLAVLSLAAALRLSAGDRTPDELVGELGNSDYDLRQNAALELLSMGYHAREDVRRALDSKDPEVKERARELWKSLRWMVFPKAGKDISASLLKLENKNADRKIWEELYSKYGFDLIYLLAEMHADRKYSDFTARGFALFLEKSDPGAVSDGINGCRETEAKDILLKYMKSISAENLNTELCVKMLAVFKKLRMYQETFIFGKNAGKTWKNDVLVHETADVVRLGNLDKKVWADCASEILDEKDQTSRENTAAFYVSLAGELSCRERMRAIIDSIDGKFTDKGIRMRICRLLLQNGMNDELLEISASGNEPVLLYMRSLALAGLGRKDESDEIWSKLPAGLNSEEDCYSIGEFMDSIGDRRAERIWERILAIDGDGGKKTIYDINAYEKLAPYYEARGEYGKAADLYEKTLAGTAALGAFILLTDSSGKTMGHDEAMKYIQAKIADLRKKENEKK